jgi:hypothetical protein
VEPLHRPLALDMAGETPCWKVLPPTREGERVEHLALEGGPHRARHDVIDGVRAVDQMVVGDWG